MYRWLPIAGLLALAGLQACAEGESAPPESGADTAGDSSDVGAADSALDAEDDVPSDTASDTASEADLRDLSPDPDLSADLPAEDTSDAADEPDGPAGEVCDNAADDDGDSRVDCHDPDCFDTAACEGQNPAPFYTSLRWRPTWSDEFEGPVPGREACYDNAQTPPQCLTLYWQVEACPDAALAALADLDKCAWSTFHLYNWMDNNRPIGEGVNAFDPAFVTVAGGELVLSAAARLPDGGLPGDWSMAQVMTQYDCGNPPATGFAWSTDCPILSGGVWSRNMGPVAGLLQTHGRFEVRARLPVGQGSWPAHWMLPQDGPWPGDGEIDIMEAVSWQPDEVGANFHDGVDIGEGEGAIHTHMSVGSMEQEIPSARQASEYHIYSVEWDADTLRFYVDANLIGTVREGTLLPNSDLATGEEVGDYPLEVPDEPFYMILNSTVAAFGADNYPDPRVFSPQYHHIDYVRAWDACESGQECPHGGTFDGANCRLGALPSRNDVFVRGADLVYPALAGAAGCPDGGEREGDLCVVYAVDAAIHAFIHEGAFYTVPACRESTLSDSPRCYHPCGGLGEYRGGRCLLGEPPEGSAGAVVVDGRFGYRPLRSGPERCPVGRDRGTYCEIGAVPEGREPYIPFEADAFYVDALCDPAEFMPNCPRPCPPGAEYRGDGCWLASPPPGRNPFVWEGGFYYDWLDTATYASRCPVGGDDGAHCLVGPVPAGFSGRITNGEFWVDSACGTVPALD